MDRARISSLALLAAFCGLTLAGCSARGTKPVEAQTIAIPAPPGGPSEEARERQERAAADPRRAEWRLLERENLRANQARRAAARLAAQSSGGSSASVPGHWTERGSSNQAGRTQVTVPSADGQTLLIGTAGGTLFTGSPQLGWQARADDLGFGALDSGIRRLLVTPGPPELWLAADYDGDVAISRDRGTSWTRPAGLPPLGEIYKIVHDGGDPRIVTMLAQTDENEAHIFCSLDGGLSFTALAGFPVTPSGLAVGDDLWTSRTETGPLYVLEGTGQLSVSSDGGATFTPLGKAGPGDTNTALLGGSEAGGPRFYALLRKDYQDWHLYASDDGGRHWDERFDLGDIFFSGNSGIGTSPSNPDLVFFGGIKAYRSVDGGRSFAPIAFGYYRDPAHQLHVDIDGIDVMNWQGHESVFIDTDGGTFLSQDGGATFLNITLAGFPNSQGYSTLTSPQDPNRIALGTQDQGFQISHPAAGVMTFDQILSGDYGNLTSSSGELKNLFFTYPGLLNFLADPGVSSPLGWLLSFEHSSFFPAVVADPRDSTSAFAAGDHILHVEHADRGTAATLTRLEQNFSPDGADYITALTISPADPSTFYAVTYEGALWASHDGGAHWIGPERVSPDFSGASILASGHDPATCFAAGGGYGGNAVYRTTDGGETWAPIGVGLPPTYVAALAFDAPATENLYAATFAGPYRFDAAASFWVNLLGTEAPIAQYMGVEGVPAAKVVRFTTFGRGVWDYDPLKPPPPPPPPPPPSRCVPDAHTLCLSSGRFEVRATWENQFDGSSGAAGAIPRSDAAGFFSFGDPTNVELLVKILPFEDTVKVFYGELTDLHFVLTVTDIQTGTVKTYRNTAGDCGAIDPAAFPKADRAETPGGTPKAAAAGACRPGPTTLCLGKNRFALTVAWANPGNGTSGKAGAVRLASDLTGAFYFTDPGNLELLAKVLDLGDRIAVFYGALSDLDYTLTVTDTFSGTARTYHNPAGNFCGGIDNTAFPR